MPVPAAALASLLEEEEEEEEGSQGMGTVGRAMLLCIQESPFCPSRNVTADTSECWILWELMALSFPSSFHSLERG